MNNSIPHYLIHHESVLHTTIMNADIPAQRIKDAMLYALFPGGKRLRPLLVYLCGELIGVTQPCLDIMAVSVELIHGYSLIHDDLPAMDNDDFRRGKPSCHRAFDEATAILAGDAMQALSTELLLTELPKVLDASQTIQVTHALVHAAGPSGMVSGQSLDMSELSKNAVSESTLRKIHALKTGRLIAACIKMVLAASEASVPFREALLSLGDHLGLVFQMQDDYMDYYMDQDALGKQRASDSANQKLTFAQLYDQQDLFDLITHQFQQTIKTLRPFGGKANNLLALLHDLEERSQA